ncbi:phage baseplate assembly protein V [Pendulispora brunnea]|uniref:Phage baseplate assembly protein V n=1 Tax=Pendulispora brunnea TaxID=2905690 RepID=A0ABZ2KLQ4_9BACT
MLPLPFDPEALIDDVLGGLTEGSPADDPFELTAGPLLTGQLRVLEFEGAEYINDLYVYTVTCTSRLPMEMLNAAADGEPACLTIKGTGEHEPRLIQGIVESIEALGPPPGDRATTRKRYRITIVPKLWLLTQRRSIRYFQFQTPKQIIEKVLADIKIAPSECHWHIKEDEYPVILFAYQREESDYEFFRRVLSDAGIFFCFEHASGTLDSLVPGAGAIAGALGTVADVVGGPVGAAVEEAGAMAKMLTTLVFTDESSHLPAVQDMALANELVGDALKDLATKIGGDTLGDMVDANPAGEIVFDDEAGGANDQERILEFGLKKRLRPKQIRMLDREVGASKNWAGVAKKDLATPSYDLGAGLSIGSITSMVREGPSLVAHAGFDLDIDSPTIAPSMLLQQLYQLDPNLRGYGDKQRRIDIELDRLRVQRIEGSGQSTCRRLAAGYRFRLAGHPVGTLNTEYTVTAMVSKGVADPASADEHVYRNSFQCAPVRIRPIPPRMPRPKLSDELARVVALRGERMTAHLDTNAYGYVHIRFDWEVVDDGGGNFRDLAYEEHDTAVWVPVSQPWAGDGYGMQCLPREGMRVWIGFIEGQGERPFVKGCFYDKENELPFAHDTDQQKIGLFSRTIPENGNWSEISISDQRDAELMRVRAARDLDVHVLNNSNTHVEGNSAEHVEGHRNIHVDKDLGTSVLGTERRAVARDRIDGVGGALKTKVGGSTEMDVTGNSTETIRGSQEHTVLGDSQVEVAGERRTVIADQEVVNIGRQHVMSVGEPDEPGRSYMTVVDGIYRRRAKTMVLEADETLILRSGKTELRLTPDTIALLSHAIQGISKELKLRGDGPTLRLDETARIYAKEIGLYGSDSLVRVADKVQIGASSALNDTAGVHKPPPRLESRYAIELFERAAELVEAHDFAAWAMAIFGSDVPPESYLTLHRNLRAKALPNAKIVLSTAGSLGGEFGSYNNKSREIHVSHDLATSAETNPRDAAELFLVLLHEFGHHVDNVLRRDYTQPPNEDDAPGEEGATFAYAIAGIDHAKKDHVVFGMHTRDGAGAPLRVDYPAFHRALKEYKEEPGRKEGGKAKTVEGFGAGGLGKPAKPRHNSLFTHGSIEDQGLDQADPVFYSNASDRRVRDKVYFGNWLRDNSQFLTPVTIKAFDVLWAGESVVVPGTGRAMLTELVDLLARHDFPGLRPYAKVTEKNLGWYVAHEHIDNPKGLPGVGDDQTAIDEFGIKAYIAKTKNFIADSLRQAARASDPERYRLLGQALHPLEDLFAHSNFIELALIRLQREGVIPNDPPVFPWVGLKSEVRVRPGGPNPDTRFPLVTGMFGLADTVVSLSEMILEKLDLPPGNQDPSWIDLLSMIYPREHWIVNQMLAPKGKRQDGEMPDDLGGAFKRLLVGAAMAPATQVKRRLAFACTQLLKAMAIQEDDFEKDVRNPDASTNTDPTHSMLSKDHGENPVHEVAAKCAIRAVCEVGRAMRRVWQDGESVERAVDTALAYIVHPNDISMNGTGMARLPAELMQIIKEFAQKNPGVIRERLNLEGSFATFKKHDADERRKLAQLANDALGEDEKLMQGMLALLPELDPYPKSEAS